MNSRASVAIPFLPFLFTFAFASVATLEAANNPVAIVYHPLVPAAVAPGSAAFTLVWLIRTPRRNNSF